MQNGLLESSVGFSIDWRLGVQLGLRAELTAQTSFCQPKCCTLGLPCSHQKRGWGSLNYTIHYWGPSSSIPVLGSDVSHARSLGTGLESNGPPHPSAAPISLSILRKNPPPQLQQAWLACGLLGYSHL